MAWPLPPPPAPWGPQPVAWPVLPGQEAAGTWVWQPQGKGLAGPQYKARPSKRPYQICPNDACKGWVYLDRKQSTCKFCGQEFPKDQAEGGSPRKTGGKSAPATPPGPPPSGHRGQGQGQEADSDKEAGGDAPTLDGGAVRLLQALALQLQADGSQQSKLAGHFLQHIAPGGHFEERHQTEQQKAKSQQATLWYQTKERVEKANVAVGRLEAKKKKAEGWLQSCEEQLQEARANCHRLAKELQEAYDEREEAWDERRQAVVACGPTGLEEDSLDEHPEVALLRSQMEEAKAKLEGKCMELRLAKAHMATPASTGSPEEPPQEAADAGAASAGPVALGGGGRRTLARGPAGPEGLQGERRRSRTPPKAAAAEASGPQAEQPSMQVDAEGETAGPVAAEGLATQVADKVLEAAKASLGQAVEAAAAPASGSATGAEAEPVGSRRRRAKS